MAEVCRIITSSLNIEEIYELFSREVEKIIPFDLISIGILNQVDKTISVAYSAGRAAADILRGRRFHSKNRFTEISYPVNPVFSFRRQMNLKWSDVTRPSRGLSGPGFVR